MRYSDEFRSRELVQAVSSRIAAGCDFPATIMEVCGTHTMSVARYGLKSLLPEGVRLISGPGCPVCVTDQKDIDAYISLAEAPSVTLATFGDMMRVPGSNSSLDRLRAGGADVRVVYSPLDAVDVAEGEPDRRVVFFAVGFETTIPATALALKSASERGISNFSVFCAHKTMPAALKALFSEPGPKVDGLLLPGHVTTITGADAFGFLADDFGLACAVSGFEPADIMLGIESVLRQIASKKPVIDNAYGRAVKREANSRAAELMAEVFTPCTSRWRGLGEIADSGLCLAERYREFDAGARFACRSRFGSKLPKQRGRDVPGASAAPLRSATEASGACRCGEVLRGMISPVECELFGAACTPAAPVGPCMVSAEGACAAAFRYGDQ